MKSKKPIDFWILITTLILLAMGTIMVFSASAAYAYNYYKDTYYFLKKQLMMRPIAFTAMFITANIDYRKLGKWSPIFVVVSIVLLILVFVPGIGTSVKGARRWLDLKVISFQPSEFAKMAVILFFSHSLSKRRDQLNSFFKGLLPYLILLGIYAALLLKEPHLSGTMVIAIVA